MSFDDPTEPGEESEDTADAVQLRPGDLIDGRYALRRLLGAGGMGEVWEAEHIALGRNMALKLLHRSKSGTDRQRSRFLREARVVSSIAHPNIVEITDFGELPEGQPFLAMKLLEGRTLRALLREDGALPWPRAVALLRQIADGLAEAHRQGIVHRDLKPENVFVGPGPKEHVTVIDFGIARKTAYDPRTAKLTATGAVFGTPGYMAPEQIRGKTANPTADIYALGCIAHELLTGRRVFEGELFERLEGHLFHPPPALPENVPSGLARLVQRCLSKAADERTATMDAVLSGLDQVGQTQRRTELVEAHVPAAPPGAPTQAARATVPGLVSATLPLTQPELAVAQPEPPAKRRGGWVVAALSAAAGLAVLGVLFAARQRPEPRAAPASLPTEPDEPAALEPSAPVTAPAPEPEPEPEPKPEPEVVVAKPKAPPEDIIETPDPAPAKTTKRRKKKTAKPERREDGTFELFPEP